MSVSLEKTSINILPNIEEQINKSIRIEECRISNNVIHKIFKEGYCIILEDDSIIIKGLCNVTIINDVNLNIIGNMDLNVEGDYNHYIKGDYNLTIEGDQITNCSGKTKIKSLDQINIESPNKVIVVGEEIHLN